jgi:hypothetical protein
MVWFGDFDTAIRAPARQSQELSRLIQRFSVKEENSGTIYGIEKTLSAKRRIERQLYATEKIALA